jgi:hypothetical protein
VVGIGIDSWYDFQLLPAAFRASPICGALIGTGTLQPVPTGLQSPVMPSVEPAARAR